MQLSMTVILTGAGYFIFSSAVGAMSPPSDAQKTRFYGWLYRFLQRLAANADRLAESRFPGLGASAGLSLVSSHERDTVAVASSGTK
jgi:hypothetical protein